MSGLLYWEEMVRVGCCTGEVGKSGLLYWEEMI